MALFIHKFHVPEPGAPPSYLEGQFHLGTTRSELREFVGAKEILLVIADGDELEVIRRQFSDIPMHTGRVVLWGKPWAQFIADNINLGVNKVELLEE